MNNKPHSDDAASGEAPPGAGASKKRRFADTMSQVSAVSETASQSAKVKGLKDAAVLDAAEDLAWMKTGSPRKLKNESANHDVAGMDAAILSVGSENIPNKSTSMVSDSDVARVSSGDDSPDILLANGGQSSFSAYQQYKDTNSLQNPPKRSRSMLKPAALSSKGLTLQDALPPPPLSSQLQGMKNSNAFDDIAGSKRLPAAPCMPPALGGRFMQQNILDRKVPWDSNGETTTTVGDLAPGFVSSSESSDSSPADDASTNSVSSVVSQSSVTSSAASAANAREDDKLDTAADRNASSPKASLTSTTASRAMHSPVFDKRRRAGEFEAAMALLTYSPRSTALARQQAAAAWAAASAQEALMADATRADSSSVAATDSNNPSSPSSPSSLVSIAEPLRVG